MKTRYKYIYGYLSRDLIYQKIHPLRDAAFEHFENYNSRSEKWTMVIISRIVTCCKNFQILTCSPLKMKSLHLLSDFHGCIFNGLGEK